MKNKKKIFLSLSVILATIVTLLIIGGTTPRKNAEITDARIKIQMLASAIETYSSTYKEFPTPTSRISDHIVTRDYSNLIEYLTCNDGPDKGNDSLYNKRKMIFLKGYNHESGYLDIWGNMFHIILDSNYDHRIKIGDESVEGKVIIYSYGPNNKNDNGQKDDICSWK